MGARILVVEDDHIALKNLGRFLTDEGYEVESATHGGEALEVLDRGTFDLVLTDLMMPVLDGNQFLRLIRAKSINIPVILMSGNFTLASPPMLYQRANGYVLKPIDLEKLLQRIKDTLEPGE